MLNDCATPSLLHFVWLIVAHTLSLTSWHFLYWTTPLFGGLLLCIFGSDLNYSRAGFPKLPKVQDNWIHKNLFPSKSIYTKTRPAKSCMAPPCLTFKASFQYISLHTIDALGSKCLWLLYHVGLVRIWPVPDPVTCNLGVASQQKDQAGHRKPRYMTWSWYYIAHIPDGIISGAL